MDDFSTSKPGDKLWAPMFGWGEVVRDMMHNNSQAVCVRFSGYGDVSFFVSGQYWENGPQCLFYDEVKIISPPKPKEKKVFVIEGVRFQASSSTYDRVILPLSGKGIDWRTFVGLPPMKMTLEWEE